MALSMAEKELHCTVEETEGVNEAPLITQQRGFEIQEDGALQSVPRPLPELQISSLEGLLRGRVVETPAEGVAYEGPGARPQVRDPLGSITLAVQRIGDAERQQAQLLTERGILEGGFEAPFHQQLEEAPGLESGGIPQ